MTRIKSRRGTIVQWQAANPVLAAAEIAVEIHSDTGKSRVKVGDGIHRWAALEYLASESELSTLLSDALADDDSAFNAAIQNTVEDMLVGIDLDTNADFAALKARVVALEAGNGGAFTNYAIPEAPYGYWETAEGYMRLYSGGVAVINLNIENSDDDGDNGPYVIGSLVLPAAIRPDTLLTRKATVLGGQDGGVTYPFDVPMTIGTNGVMTLTGHTPGNRHLQITEFWEI